MSEKKMAVATCGYITCIGLQNIIEVLKLMVKTPQHSLGLLKLQLFTEIKEFFEERNYERQLEKENIEKNT